MAKGTLSNVDFDDLFTWVYEQGLSDLINSLTDFFDSQPLLYHNQDSTEFEPYHDKLRDLRVSFASYLAVRHVMDIKNPNL